MRSPECQRWYPHFPGGPQSWVPLQDPAVLKLLGREHSDGLQSPPGPAACQQTLLSLSYHHPAAGALGWAVWLLPWAGRVPVG